MMMTSWNSFQKMIATRSRRAVANSFYLQFSTKTDIFKGSGISRQTIQKLEEKMLFDPRAIELLGVLSLKEIGLTQVESAIVLSWVMKIREMREKEEKKNELEREKEEKKNEREREKEEKKNERERERKEKAIQRALNRKNIFCAADKLYEFSIHNNKEFDSVSARFGGLQELYSNKGILSLDDLEDKKVYAPMWSIPKLDVKTLQIEISNLAKSKAEYSARKHIQDHLQLHSSVDVEFLGSEVELKNSRGNILGDVDTLYRVRTHKMFILMERKTTLGVHATKSLEEQVRTSSHHAA